MGDLRVRPLVQALIRRADEILVERERDETAGKTFFRLLGGEIEFGELAVAALHRELFEELGTSEIEVNECVATIENVFTWEGKPGHEIVLVYECRLTGTGFQSGDEWKVYESTPRGPTTHEVAWKPIDVFLAGAETLYPEALMTLLHR